MQQSWPPAPRVVEAIRAQAQQLCFVTSAWGASPVRALRRCCWRSPVSTGGRVFFTLGGADANEHAVKFARQAAGKPRGWMITRDRSYHGASYAAMAFSGDSRTAAQADPERLSRMHVPPPYAYRCPFGTASAAACGEAAAAHIAERIDARAALRGRRGPDGAERGHQRHRRAATASGPRCARQRARAACI